MKIKLLLFLILQLTLFASIDILKESTYFIDSTNKLTIKNISNAKFEEFKNLKSEKINLGYVLDTVWIKFKLTNNQKKDINKVLVLDNNMLDSIILFTKNKVTYTKKTTGIINNFTFDENIINFYFDIHLKKDETKEYYLKVSSASSALHFKLELMTKDDLYKNEIKHQIILSLFFGAMLALIIYNLFVYYFTRDIAYVYYISYLAFTIVNHISFTSMNSYIFSANFIKTEAYFSIYYISFATLFSLLYTKELLNIKS